MSLQRGENVRGWSGVTKNMAVNSDERAAWRFMMFSMMVALIITGTMAYILSQTDIPVVAKALLGLLFLLFTLVLISGIYSVKMRRASGGQAENGTTGMQSSSSPASTASTTTTAAEEAAQAAARAAQEERARIAAEEAAAAAKAAAAARAVEEATEQERQRHAAAEAEAAAAKAAEDARQRAEAEASAAKTSKDLGPDRDGDGVAEGKDEGVRPAGLNAARDGHPDDLKLIKGVGPKLEQLCNSLGFYHFDQIANWTSDEVAWVDSNLQGFTGRVTRDEWVSQAKILAAGGTTEFAERQKDG